MWTEEELAGLKVSHDLGSAPGDALTKYNPAPGAGSCGGSGKLVGHQRRVPLPRSQARPPTHCAGSGRTGYLPVPPNNYPFYNDDEKYVPVMQADGGQLSGAAFVDVVALV